MVVVVAKAVASIALASVARGLMAVARIRVALMAARMRESWRSVAGWLWREVRRVANERKWDDGRMPDQGCVERVSWRAAVAGSAEVGVSSSGGVRTSGGGRGRG